MKAIDKSTWPEGPWMQEKDFEVFTTAAGYTAMVWRMYRGNLNGYVMVPEGHALHGKEYDARIKMTPEHEAIKIIDTSPIIPMFCHDPESELISLEIAVQVHGGLTFSGTMEKRVEDGVPTGWWFGFDTSHCYDLTPADEFSHRMAATVYRSWDYVCAEVEKLAVQLKELATVETYKEGWIKE